MAWKSPRAAKEDAKRMAENRARDFERRLGRSLTGEELRQVHQECEESTQIWAARNRRGS